MKWKVGLVCSLLAVLGQVKNVSAEEVSFSKLFAVRNINVTYVAMRLAERPTSLRTGRAARWVSTCRNLGSLAGNDFCWRAGKQRFRIPLPEVGWVAYDVLHPRVLWQFGNIDVHWPPGVTYESDIKGGLTVEQRGKWTSLALRIRF